MDLRSRQSSLRLRAPKSMLKEYIRWVKGLADDCVTADKSCNQLLNMKKSKANVVDASFARGSSQIATCQTRKMMTFTIITVSILPLSFFTSLVGINVRNWTGQVTGTTQRKVVILMGSVSAAIMTIVPIAAFAPTWVSEQAAKIRRKARRAPVKFAEFKIRWSGKRKGKEAAPDEGTAIPIEKVVGIEVNRKRRRGLGFNCA